MDVKIYAMDGFKKGRNRSMDGTCRENLSFLSKGVKQSPKKAWEGLFLMSTAMNNYIAYSSLCTQQHLNQHSPAHSVTREEGRAQDRALAKLTTAEVEVWRIEPVGLQPSANHSALNLATGRIPGLKS